MNKDFINVLNSSMDNKKIQLNALNKNSDSFNELSTILQEQNNFNNFEFSHSDFSLTMEKERENNQNCIILFNFYSI